MKWWLNVYMCPNLPLLHPHQSCSGLRSFLKVVDVPRHEVYTSEVVGGMSGSGSNNKAGGGGAANLQSDLTVSETLTPSELAFTVPVELLRIWTSDWRKDINR